MAFKVSFILRQKHGALREALQKREWSQKKAAKYLGMSEVSFGKIMNLQWVPKEFTRKQSERLMKLTGQTIDDLFPQEIRDPEFLASKKIFERSVEVDPQLLLGQMRLLALPPQQPDEILEEKERDEKIERLISTLPGRRASAMRMHLLEGKTVEEIAEQMHYNRTALYTIVRDCVRVMRRNHQRELAKEFLDLPTI